MIADNSEDRKRRIFMWSIILHMLLVTAIALPVFQVHNQNKLLYEGIMVDFSNRTSKTSNQHSSRQKTKSNPNKKAAKANTQKPKTAQSAKKPTVAKKVKSQPEKASARSLKAVKSETPVTDQNKNTEAEKRRAYIKKQMEARAEAEHQKTLEEERMKELAQKARMEKFEKMKSAFSQILENASDETTNHSDLNLSGEGLPQPDLDNGLNHTTGLSEELGDRKVLFVPEIKDHTHKQGRVVINICVNAEGNVSSARYTQKGSTTTDAYLIKLAEKNARLYKFSKSKAPKQCGIVNIDFIVT